MTKSTNSFIIIIPSRYESSRFPGKPLVKIGEKEMVIHVIEKAKMVCDNVVVATDDSRIYDCVERAGYNAVMTSTKHKSGTDRVMEAYKNSKSDAEVIINIQGDEPFIDPEQIKSLMSCFNEEPETQIATLCKKFNSENCFEALEDPNLVKLTFDSNHNALYFSRSVIPYVRGIEKDKWLETTDFYTHIGIYAYRAEILNKISTLPQTSLEKAESLEQLRWLQSGFRIKVKETSMSTIGIDTPDDLKKAIDFYNSNLKQ